MALIRDLVQAGEVLVFAVHRLKRRCTAHGKTGLQRPPA
jgi:hypothetical protein